MKKIILLLTALTIFSACQSEKVVIEDNSKLTVETEISEEIKSPQLKENIQEFAFGVIIPSELFSFVDSVESIYLDIADSMNPSIVVLIMKNENVPSLTEEQLPTIKTCLKCDLLNGYQELIDSDLQKQLLNSERFTVKEDKDLKNEFTIKHFEKIKKHFPKAKVLPIFLEAGTNKEELNLLSDWLDFNLPQGGFTILATKNSLNVNHNFATFQSAKTKNILETFDQDQVSSINTDCSECFKLFIDLMTKRRYLAVKDFIENNLSFYAFFTAEEKLEKDFVSMLFFGNSVEPKIGIKNAISFNLAEYFPADDKFLKAFSGSINNIFKGTDFLIFSSENSCQLEIKHSLSLAFCGFDSTSSDFTYFEDLLLSTEKPDFIVGIVNFPGAQLTAEDKKFVTDLSLKGLDFIVGQGIKEIAPIELINDVPVAYSLGSFKTDSGLALDLELNSTGSLLGLTYDGTNIELYPLSLLIENGYPTFSNQDQQKEHFDLMKKNLIQKENATFDGAKIIIKAE